MKKSLLIAAACVALVSCAKDEAAVPKMDASDSRITFEAPIVAPSTRTTGDVANGEAFPTDWDFGVYAKWYDNTFDYWSTGVEYINNAQAKYASEIDMDDTYNGWTTTTPYYWPKNGGSLTFQAYSPYMATGAKIDAAGVSFTDYQMLLDGNQVDVMYSKRSYDRVDNSNNYTIVGSEANSYNGVDLLFQHALTTIKFTAQTDKDYESENAYFKIRIKEIILMNVASKGTFYQNLADDKTDNESPVWVNIDGQTHSYTNVVTDAAGKEIAVNGLDVTKDFCNDLLVLPQTFAKDATTPVPADRGTSTKFKIVYEVESVAGKPITQTYYADLNDYVYKEGSQEIGDLFKIGRQYNFHMIFSLDKIYFAPVVGNWVGVTITDVQP